MNRLNPLYPPAEGLPPFDRISAADVAPALDQALDQAQREVDRLAAAEGAPDWASLMAPLEAIDEGLSRLWSPVSHLNAVTNSEALREAHNSGLTRVTAFHTRLGQNRDIHRRIGQLLQSGAPGCSDEQRRAIELSEREFRLGGVALEGAARERFLAISERLSALASRFSDQLLDATAAWTRLVKEEDELAGLPEAVIGRARQKAVEASLDGWLFDLELPTYLAVMNHAESRALRRELYHAYNTRASDRGPDAGRFDNGPLIEEILALRHERATLLGYRNHVDYALEKRMASSADEVVDFLRSLAARARPHAMAELDQLRDYAREQGWREPLEPWDIPYWSERLRVERTSISQEALRPWFPLPKVLSGLFTILERLFGLRFRPLEGVALWHPDASCYALADRDGVERGTLYIDLFARANKRGGAWMAGCRSRSEPVGEPGGPIALVNCNFAPPPADGVARLSHDEVTTLFHEFGHALHHTLTRITEPSIAGINGVPWDAVELPSQLLENWCWQQPALELITAHVDSGEPLPATIATRLLAARRFQSGMMMVRQLEFALFDLLIHRHYDPATGSRQLEWLQRVRDEVAVIDYPEWHRFPNGFSHIFAGGYAAGYYSYKWAELLSADAFSLFEERGIFDHESGQRLLATVLERGGAEDAMALYRRFRGREPTIDSLLRQCGLEGESP